MEPSQFFWGRGATAPTRAVEARGKCLVRPRGGKMLFGLSANRLVRPRTARLRRPMIIVPIEQATLLWGWPNRFLQRMREHHTQVMLIGKIQSLSSKRFSRLDTQEELLEVPRGFGGLIWTDRVGVIGPLAAARRR